MEQTVRFDYHINLNAKELWQFSMYHANRGMMLPFNALITLGSLCMLIFRWSEFSPIYRVLLVMCAGMFTIWQPFLLYLKAKKQARMPAISQVIKMGFTEAGIDIEQAGNEAHINWDQIARVEMAPAMVVFYMDRIRAYLIPKDMLGENEEAFRQCLRSWVPKERRKRV